MLVDNDNDLMAWGGSLKQVREGVWGGYLVRFTDIEDPDLDDDYFTKQTDYGRPVDAFPAKFNLYYAHGMDSELKGRPVGVGRSEMRDDGLWYEMQLSHSDKYRKMIDKLLADGRLGLSSGAASHLVERTPRTNRSGKTVHEIVRWPLGEASLTPRPAEPRNMVGAIKSFALPEWKLSSADVAGDMSESDMREDGDADIVPHRPATIREFERLLRDAAGFNRREATLVAAGGWGALTRDAAHSKTGAATGKEFGFDVVRARLRAAAEATDMDAIMIFGGKQ